MQEINFKKVHEKLDSLEVFFIQKIKEKYVKDHKRILQEIEDAE